MSDRSPELTVLADPARARHSPCLGVCHLDQARGLCTGCGRTGREIGDWAGMSDAERLGVYAHLPDRVAMIGAGVRLLPWMADDILNFVAGSLRGSDGTWVVGTANRASCIACADVSPEAVRRDATAVRTDNGTATLAISTHDTLRAYAIQENGRDGPIVLGLPRRRADEILARRQAPRRDWLLPPADEPAGIGCACAGAGQRHTFVTALASLAITTPRSDEAALVMARAAPLPRFAVAMAIYVPEFPSRPD